MDNNLKTKLITIPVKVLTIIVAFMILMRFGYVFYDFILNPFHEPAILSPEAVKHTMTALILLELLALTLRFLIHDILDPNIIIITVMTAIGRDLIVLNIKEMDYAKVLVLGFIFLITIFGLYILKKKPE